LQPGLFQLLVSHSPLYHAQSSPLWPAWTDRASNLPSYLNPLPNISDTPTGVERALTETAMMVVMVTSTHEVTEICTDIASCPPYTTAAQTSVVYVTATTTVCLLSSTPPGYSYGPPATTNAPSSATSPGYPSGSPDIHVSIITAPSGPGTPDVL
jgi:hypothetical protein